MPSIDDPKPVIAELAPRPFWSGGRGPSCKAMCPAMRRASLLRFREEAARDLELGRDEQVAVVLPQVREKGDALGVTHKPGGFLIGGIGSIIEGGNPQDDSEAAAVGAHCAAWRRSGARRAWHQAKISGGWG